VFIKSTSYIQEGREAPSSEKRRKNEGKQQWMGEDLNEKKQSGRSRFGIEMEAGRSLPCSKKKKRGKVSAIAYRRERKEERARTTMSSQGKPTSEEKRAAII